MMMMRMMRMISACHPTALPVKSCCRVAKSDTPVRTRPLTETRFDTHPINRFHFPSISFIASFLLHGSPASFLGNQAPPLPLPLWASTFLRWEQEPGGEEEFPPEGGSYLLALC